MPRQGPDSRQRDAGRGRLPDRVPLGKLPPDPFVAFCTPFAPVPMHCRRPASASSSVALPEPRCLCAECTIPPSILFPFPPPVPPVCPPCFRFSTLSHFLSFLFFQQSLCSGTSLKAGAMGGANGNQEVIAASAQSSSRSASSRHICPAGQVEGHSTSTPYIPSSYSRSFTISHSCSLYISPSFSSSNSPIPTLDLSSPYVPHSFNPSKFPTSCLLYSRLAFLSISRLLSVSDCLLFPRFPILRSYSILLS